MSISDGFYTSKEAFYTYGTLSEQNQQLINIDNNGNVIRGQVGVYNQLRNSMNDKKEYLDLCGNYLQYRDGQYTVKQAALDDLNQMIVQQNNFYIFGMIGVTVVLLATLIILRK